MKLLFKLSKAIFWLGLIAVLFIIGCNLWVVLSTRDQVISEADNLPETKTGLLLGTSKFFRSGSPNLFFRYRMEAAADLLEAGKIRYILASGDNSEIFYNEPVDMRNALIELGVPEERITLDYAGLSTFDSVVRSNKIFGQTEITIITQRFHCYRALFIARYFDIKAVAYPTNKVPSSFRTEFREYFARCKAVLDLYIFEQEPTYLGDKELIGEK